MKATKKPKQESFQQQPNQTMQCPPICFNLIAATFENCTKSIVDAIDRNSKAIKCQEQTLFKIVSSLGRIEQSLERKQSQKTTSSQGTEKENKRPAPKETKQNKK